MIYRPPDESNIWKESLDLDSFTSYSELQEENRRLRQVLAEIHKVSKFDE